MAQYIYTTNRLSKVVSPKRYILRDISLSFFPGAKIGVLGLNGAGKSTLLRIMAGVDKEFDGEARPQPGIKIGFLPQEPELNPSSSPSRANSRTPSMQPEAGSSSASSKSPPTLCGCRRGTRTSHRYPAVNADGLRCAGCYLPAQTCCCWTNPRTTWTPSLWPG